MFPIADNNAIARGIATQNAARVAWTYEEELLKRYGLEELNVIH